MQFSHNYTNITFVLSLCLLPPSHPSRSSQSARLGSLFFFFFVCLFVFFFGSLCFIATSHQLAILHTLLYVCQGYLCICPTLCFPNCVHQFVLCICIFIPSLQPGSSIQFSRFCIYELIYNICFFFSFWLTSLSITGSRLIHLTRTDSNSFFYITE